MATPALPPPPGVTSNFDHPLTLKRQNNIAIGVSIPLTTIFFFLRAYTRIWIKRTWILEDWLTLISYSGTLALCGTGAAVMNHFGGRHEWDITSSQAHEAFYWFNVASINYGVAIGIAKISVLFLYRRVFSPVRWSLFDVAIVFLIIILALFYIATTIVKIWECVPREKIYDSTVPGTCVDVSMLLNVSGLFNTITDFIIVLLPLKAVWSIRMNVRTKIVVVLVFTFGLIAPIFSLVGFLVRLRGSTNPDKTWVQPEIVQWGIAELTSAILCVCLPELGVLWKEGVRRPRPGQSARIASDRSRQENISSRKRSKYGFSETGSYALDTMNTEPYVLLEGSSYHVEGAPQKSMNGGRREQIGQGVMVTQEILVHSTSIRE
ncbi:hypothetical protein F4777DRAFT_526343 [Nemania sp. FL0916]|nr:hypothetical protein F4777DRAFT_526343 [Nemania sp. FL0916]